MRTYFRILGYGRPYIHLGIIALVCLISYSLFNALSLVMIKPFLDILFQESAPQAPPQALELFNMDSVKAHADYFLWENIQRYGKMGILPYYCALLLLLFLAKNVSRYFSTYCMAPLEQGIILGIRAHLFSHLSVLGLGFFMRRKKGSLIGTVVSDVQVVQEAVISTVQSLIREPLTMVVLLFFLQAISWKLTLFTLIVLPLTGIFISFIRRSLKRKSKLGQEELGKLIANLDEFVSGIRIVKAFQKEGFERKKYNARNESYRDLQVNIRRQVGLASPVTEMISIMVVCAIIIVAGTLILSDRSELSGSAFITFIMLFSQLMMPIRVLSNAVAKIQKGIAAFERVEELLDVQPLVKNKPDAKMVEAFKDTLAFEGVFFKYEEEDVLKAISFEVKKGETIALVGPSGGGKSTLADLIPRFYDPYKGKVLLDGQDIRDLKVEGLRGLIGNVTQEGILFHDTVLANIAYGIEQPSIDKVIEAAKVANAHDFIEQLPEGYHTVIGERGLRLSGGQRQRISIARAVLRNPPILILDEATSNLDTESERLVQDALEKLMENRTSVVIAHRLSTILNAEQILVISKGEIVERGSHKDLLAMQGVYRKLYDLQFESQYP